MAETLTPAQQIAEQVEKASVPGADLLAIAVELQRLSGVFSGALGGQRDAVAAQEAAVRVLRLPQPNPDLVAEQATRLAEYVHTLAARRNDAGDPGSAASAAREAVELYRAAAQVAGADLPRIVGQLTALAKLSSAFGIPDTALSATQLAVALHSSTMSVPPAPEQQLLLANLQQNLTARYLEVAQVDQATLTGQLATQTLIQASQTVWAQVGDLARQLTSQARNLLAGGLPIPAGAALRAARSAMEDPPVLLAPDALPLDPVLPDAARTLVVAVGERKDLVRRLADSGAAIGAVLAGGGLMETASAAQALTATYTPGRFCGTADDPPYTGGGIQLQIFGQVRKRWPARQALRVSINPVGCQPAATMVAAAPGVIIAQFAAWAAAIRGPAGPIFSFTFVPPGSGEDINVTFIRKDGDPPAFGVPGGTDGLAEGAPSGSIRLDPGVQWTPGILGQITLHEIGHMLGLTHSSAPGSIMYPYVPNAGIDPESIQALTLAYAPGPQLQLPDRGTSGRPALSSTRVSSLTGTTRRAHMVWKGVGDDQGIYHADLGPTWSAPDKIPGAGTIGSPAAVEVGGPEQTGLLVAWRGIEDDQGIYWTRLTSSGWERQRNIAGRGSADGPALVMTPTPSSGGVYMAWRGIEDDQGIYTSIWDGNEGWSNPVGPIAGRGTSHTPAMAMLNGRLYMFWKGVEDDHAVYWSMLDLNQLTAPTPSTPIWTSQRQVTWDTYETGGATPHAIGSTTGPVATTRGNAILLAWKGAEDDSQIWLTLFDGTSFTGQMPIFDAGTSHGPGLVDIDGVSYLAWRGAGGDSTIWWKSV